MLVSAGKIAHAFRNQAKNENEIALLVCFEFTFLTRRITFIHKILK